MPNIDPEISSQWKSFIEGNNTVIQDIYLKYHDDLLMHAYSMLSNQEQAKDIVASVYMKLLEMPPKKRKELLADSANHLDQFLHYIVKNKCIDHLRQEKNRIKLQKKRVLPFLPQYSSPDELMEEDISFLLQMVPGQQKKILQLHLDGYSNQDIADDIKISYNTVRNTLTVAKKKVRKLWNSFMIYE